MPRASYSYLQFSGRPIFGRSQDGFSALHDANGKLRGEGETVCIPHLSSTLERLAQRGAVDFYSGELGQLIVEHVRQGGGRMSLRDRSDYGVIHRQPLIIDVDEWKVATNPPPAIGGAVLAAMLRLMIGQCLDSWDEKTRRRLVEVQRAVLGYRREKIDGALDTGAAVLQLMEEVSPDTLDQFLESPSTVHTSAVDSDGLTCAVTLSSGYGAGEMPASSGIWLNNCLGELELNQVSPWNREPGDRLPSNMAPTVAWVPGTRRVLAIGSPGADRITTALLQVLLNYLVMGQSLQASIAYPRAHLEWKGENFQVACEPGVGLESTNIPLRLFEDASMFFGGVGAACWDPDQGFIAAADPRRTGATWQTPTPE